MLSLAPGTQRTLRSLPARDVKAQTPTRGTVVTGQTAEASSHKVQNVPGVSEKPELPADV